MTVVAARVLVVDHDKTVREWIRGVLAKGGYEAILAGSFEDAKAAMAAMAPDVLVVDVRLGPFNGLQLVNEAPPGLPCIVMTSVGDDAEGALQLGSYFVVKPLTEDGLLTTIQRAVASAEHRMTIGSRRHWTRKTVEPRLEGLLDGRTKIRIVDVSYGGVRLEIDPAHPPPQTFTLTVGERRVSVNVMLVWKQHGDERLVCGAVLSTGNSQSVNDWVSFVDAAA
jgi:DNA-binding response OmpR family regulator